MLVANGALGLLLIGEEGSRLFQLNEAGYGDSYILYDVLQFQKTGIVYRDLSQPPYLPAQYSPLVYLLYSLPGWVVNSANPFIGPRMITIAAFLICLGIVTSIVRVLIPIRHVWIWSVLLVGATASMSRWLLQLRGDFPGIALSLLAIRLLLSGSPWRVPIAGVCAGLAIHFKITFVAASVAGTFWLLLRREWRNALSFAGLAAVSSLGLYLLYAIREPRMFSHMLALAPGVVDAKGSFHLMRDAVGELLVPLALLSLSMITWRMWRRCSLIVIFAVTSFVIARLTSLQAGGNVNYYFELFFGIIPLAVLGALRLISMSRRNVAIGFIASALLGIYFLTPAVARVYFRLTVPPPNFIANETLSNVEGALSDHRILSTVPRLAIIDPNPTLTEPYLLSYLHRLGKADLQPLTERIDRNEYDVVITRTTRQSWRGIPHIEPELQKAIAASYQPWCAIGGVLFHFPRTTRVSTEALARRLATIGCQSPPAAASRDW